MISHKCSYSKSSLRELLAKIKREIYENHKNVSSLSVFLDCDYIIKPECDSYLNSTRKVREISVVSDQWASQFSVVSDQWSVNVENKETANLTVYFPNYL